MKEQEISLTVASHCKTDLDRMFYALKMEALMQEMGRYNSYDDISDFIQDKKYIRMKQEDRCLFVLAYYILYGFSRQTVEDCRKHFNLSTNRINQINHILTKQGYLERHKHNNTLREIPSTLLAIKDVVLNEGTLGVSFIKNDE